jgi:hypothetical protein
MSAEIDVTITVFPDHTRKDSTVSKYVQCWCYSVTTGNKWIQESNMGYGTKRQAMQQAIKAARRLQQRLKGEA